MNNRLAAIAFAFGSLLPAYSSATVLECRVTRKLDSERVYSEEHLKKANFKVLIEETTTGAKVSRCDMSPSLGRESCDAYDVDRIEFDERVHLKKFYVFRNQLDVQVFSDLTFVENNGRGGIAFGTCKAKSP